LEGWVSFVSLTGSGIETGASSLSIFFGLMFLSRSIFPTSFISGFLTSDLMSTDGFDVVESFTMTSSSLSDSSGSCF